MRISSVRRLRAVFGRNGKTNGGITDIFMSLIIIHLKI